MSLKPCRYTGLALAENTTCGGLCDMFPACLPLPSPHLVAEVAQLKTQAVVDHQSYTATAQALEAIHEALDIRLDEGE
jgi:hypothetical protein